MYKNYIKNKKKYFDPDVIRTRSLLIWSQTRYHCATESYMYFLCTCNNCTHVGLHVVVDKFNM